MAITPLPTPPSREDPTNFATRADAFMAALPAFATETNAVAVEVDNDRIASASSASSAASQVGLAEAQVALATTQVGLATTQATNSANSATASANSATSANNARIAAESARDATLAAYDSFDDRYLGTKTTDPAVDNDGNPLVAGALYFNSVSGVMKLYTGSAWVAAYVTGTGYLTASENLNDLPNKSTARTNLGLAIGTNVQAYDADLTAWAGKTAPTGDAVGSSDSQTLTNKTIAYADNTLTGVQPSLVSGTSIKTINSTSLLGSGDIAITGGLTFDFPYSENITAGDILQLLSSGQVEKVKETIAPTTQSIPKGTKTDGPKGTQMSIKFDKFDGSKFVYAYLDSENGYYPTVRAGTISGSTITLGNAVLINSSSSGYQSLSLDTDPSETGKFVVCYRDSNDYYGYARVGTVSGTSVTIGSAYVFLSRNLEYSDLKFDPAGTGKFVIAFRDAGGGDIGGVICGTRSANALSFGTRNNGVNSGQTTRSPQITFQKGTTGQFLLTYMSAANAERPCVEVGTISGTTISLDSRQYLDTESTNMSAPTFDPVSGKFIVLWARQSGSAGRITSVSIAGTTLTVASSVAVSGDFALGATRFEIRCDQTYGSQKIIFMQRSYSVPHWKQLQFDGTTFTELSDNLVAGVAFYEGNLSCDLAPTGSGVFIGVLTPSISSALGPNILGIGQLAVNVTTTNLDSTKLIGVAQESGTTGQTKKVAIKGGIDSVRTSLTPQTTYYVQGDGTVSTTSTAPAVKLGRAISSTSLLLVGEQ